jgi:type I restriction enzyme S subunit
MSKEDAELYDKMLKKLEELDEKSGKKKTPENQARDILIALTCMKNCLTLVTNDNNLKKVAQDFQCSAITFEQLLKGEYREFKDTEIGRIPKEWKVVRAIDVARYINGYAFGPEDWKTKGVPIIRIQNLNDPNAEFNYFDGEIDEIYRVNNGDLLFSWSASIGVYIWKGGEAVLNQHIFKVIPGSQIDKLFLYYVLFLAIEQLRRRVHGSTMKHFRRGELKIALIPLPSFSEQQKIAEILSTVDKKIELEKNEKAKLERIKQGLMDLLLTGKIRIKVN